MVLALIVFSAIFSIPLTHARGAATSGNAVEALHVARRRTELGAGLVRFFSCMDQPYLDDSSLRTNEFVDWDPNGKLPIHLSASLWEKGKNPAANQVSWMTTSGGPRWEHTCMMLLGRQPAGKNIIWHGSWHDAGAPTMYIDRKDTGLLGHDIATMDITDWQKKTNTLFEVATTHIDSFRGKPYKLEAYRKGMNNAKYVQQWGLNPIPVEGGPSNYPKSMPNDDDLVRFLLANKPAGIENKPPNSDLTVGVTFDDVAALLCPSQKHCEALLQAQGVDILLDKKVPVLLIPDALTDVSRAEVFEGNAEGPALAAVEPASLQDFKVGASSQGPSPAPQSPLPPTPTPAHPHPVGPGVPHQPDATGVWVWESRPWSGLEIGLVVLGALLLVGACVTTVVFFRRASSVGSLPKYQETDSSVPESESGGRSKNWRVCTLIVLIIQVFLGLALVVGVPVFRSQQTEVRSTITPKRSVGSPSLGSPGGKPDSPGPGPQPHTTSHPPAGETPPQQQAADAPTGVSTWPHGFDILRSLLTFNGHGAFSSTKFQIPKNSNVYILAPMGRDPSGQSSKYDIFYNAHSTIHEPCSRLWCVNKVRCVRHSMWSDHVGVCDDAWIEWVCFISRRDACTIVWCLIENGTP